MIKICCSLDAYTPENIQKWNEFIDKALNVGSFREYKNRVSDFLKEKGLPGLDDDYTSVFNFSPYLNIYTTPKELDYQEEGRELPGNNWFRSV